MWGAPTFFYFIYLSFFSSKKNLMGSKKNLWDYHFLLRGGGRGGWRGGQGGWRKEGRTNERPRTNHVIWGPMRGLGGKKMHLMAQTDRYTHSTGRHGDFMTESAQCFYPHTPKHFLSPVFGTFSSLNFPINITCGVYLDKKK